MAKAVLEGTGHDCEVARTVARKNDIKLNTPTGGVIGERSLNVELGEQTTVENTKEIYPGLFVSGMAANGCLLYTSRTSEPLYINGCAS